MPAIRKKSVSTKDKEKIAARTCGVCYKVLGRPGDLRRHIESAHEGIKSFACDYCDKRFAQKTGRDIHHNTHTGAKPYACGLCPTNFGDPSCRKRHRKQQHGTIMSNFNCPICSLRLEAFDLLTKHLDTRHKTIPRSSIARSSWTKRRRSSSLIRRRSSSFAIALGISRASTRRKSLARRCKEPTPATPQVQLTDEDGNISAIQDHNVYPHAISRTPSPSAPSIFTSMPFTTPTLHIDNTLPALTAASVLESPRGTRFDSSVYYSSPSRFESPLPSTSRAHSREHTRTPEPIIQRQPELVPPSSTVPVPFLTPGSSSLLAPAAFTPSLTKWGSFSWNADLETRTAPSQQPSASTITNGYLSHFAPYLGSLDPSLDAHSSAGPSSGAFDYDFSTRDPRRLSFGFSEHFCLPFPLSYFSILPLTRIYPFLLLLSCIALV